MGLLDDVLKEFGGAAPLGAPAQAHQSLATELMRMLGGAGVSGGLPGLVAMFNQKGLGDIVQSWISNGKNLPISAEQIQHVLGSAQLQALAAKAGIDPQTAGAMVAKILPTLVDKATPGGQMPAGGGLGDLLRRMGG